MIRNENFYFDYIYYKLQKFYKKWDGENSITPIIGISMIQTLSIVDFFLIFLKSIFSKNEIADFSKILGYSSVGLLIGLMIFNHYKYKNKYSSFEKKWGAESKSLQLIKSVVVIFSLVFPWLVLYIISKY